PCELMSLVLSAGIAEVPQCRSIDCRQGPPVVGDLRLGRLEAVRGETVAMAVELYIDAGCLQLPRLLDGHEGAKAGLLDFAGINAYRAAKLPEQCLARLGGAEGIREVAQLSDRRRPLPGITQLVASAQLRGNIAQ